MDISAKIKELENKISNTEQETDNILQNNPNNDSEYGLALSEGFNDGYIAGINEAIEILKGMKE